MSQLGMKPGSVWIGNFPVGVTGPKGGQHSAEAASHYHNFIIELKKSPGAVTPDQAQAHAVAVGERVNFRRRPAYWRIYGHGGPKIKPRR